MRRGRSPEVEEFTGDFEGLSVSSGTTTGGRKVGSATTDDYVNVWPPEHLFSNLGDTSTTQLFIHHVNCDCCHFDASLFEGVTPAELKKWLVDETFSERKGCKKNGSKDKMSFAYEESFLSRVAVLRQWQQHIFASGEHAADDTQIGSSTKNQSSQKQEAHSNLTIGNKK